MRLASAVRAVSAAWAVCAAWAVSDRLDMGPARLNRPALPTERGTLDRLGRGLLLNDLDLGTRPAVLPGHSRAVPWQVGRCAGWRPDDEATTSSGCRFGLAIGGGLPAVRLGLAMARPHRRLLQVNCRVLSPSPAQAIRSRTMGTKSAFVFPIRWKRAQFRARWQALQNRFRPTGGG